MKKLTAIVKNGKLKGRLIEIAQCCNDWASIQTPNIVIGIDRLWLNHETVLWLKNHEKEMGVMFREFELVSNILKAPNNEYYFIFRKRR